MKVGLMVEGQNGLTWDRWRHIVAMAERLGFSSLFRSDHYFIGRQRETIETYMSLALEASESRTVRFGPLVTPVTFKTPVDLGRMAAQLHVLSGGAVRHGSGGWLAWPGALGLRPPISAGRRKNGPAGGGNTAHQGSLGI